MEEPILKKKSILNRIINNQLTVTIFTTILMIFVVVGSSYAIFSKSDETGNNDVVVVSGEMEAVVSSEDDTITDEYTDLGVTDEVGLAGESYDFTVTNTGENKIVYYEVRIIDKEYAISTMPHKALKFSISHNSGEYTTPSNLGDNGSYIYVGGPLEVGETDTFRLKLWVSDEFGELARDKELIASLELTLYSELPTRNYIIYDLNGGVGIVPKTSVSSGKVTDIIPKNGDKVFKGWSEDKDATEPEYLSGGAYTKDTGTILYAIWELPPSGKTLENLNLTVNTSAEGCPVEGQQITSIAGADVDLICPYSDDDGTSYYFRGASSHNYVKWAGFYWRIIRINGDGNIRMIYVGEADIIDAKSDKQEFLANGYTGGEITDYNIGKNQFNEQTNFFGNHFGNAKIGLMYGNNLPEVYDTAGVLSTESVTESIVSSTLLYYFGDSYEINSKEGKISLKSYSGSSITVDTIENLIGKYVFSSTNIKDSYSIPLILVESVDSTDLTITGKKVNLKLIDGLNIVESYNRTHENKVSSTILGNDSSTSTNTLNGWYNTNIKGTEYESQVADSIICNDRSLYKASYGSKYSDSFTYDVTNSYSGTDVNRETGIGVQVTGYGSYYRQKMMKPSLKCENQNDRFTVNNGNGNQALVNPIGLVTADEVMLAGGSGLNTKYYLYTGHGDWTLSPAYLENTGIAHMYGIGSHGQLSATIASNNFRIRPVLSINPNKVDISGTGTLDDPFVFTGK